MKHLLCIFLLFAMAACASDKKSYSELQPEQAYEEENLKHIQFIDDIPLPAGFYIKGGEPMIFDTPNGRIVEAEAEGIGSEKQIEQFYDDTLPQLGWEKKLGIYKGGVRMSFAREDEKLDVHLKHDQAKITVKYSLYPSK